MVKSIMVVAILSMLAWGFGPSPVEADAVEIEFVGGSPEQHQVVLEAASTYAAQGLELPPLRVEFETGSCGVYGAIYIYVSAVVRFCTEDFSRQLALHELGHAWDDHNMTEERRAAYASRFGQGESWFDSEVDHSNRTYERFANTVTARAKGMLSQDQFDALIGEVSSGG